MSTKRNAEELNSEQLSQVTGGEDGGFSRELPGIGPKKGFFHESDNPTDRLLNDEQLSQATGGEDGGFSRELPGIGPKKGFFHESDNPADRLLNDD